MRERTDPSQPAAEGGAGADGVPVHPSGLGAPSVGHVPVLLSEVLEALAPDTGETYLDCTAGLGGHAAAVAERLGPTGSVVLCDQDTSNLERARNRLSGLADAVRPRRIEAVQGSFARLPRRMAELGLSADCVLADLGFSSNQMDDPQRGLSFMRDGPLDMRLNRDAPISAAELVNTLPVQELGEILRDFGEEPGYARIADKIAASRKISPIQTTSQLAAIVRSVVPRRPGMAIDPATRTFQALRIAVNDELGALGVLLEAVARAALMRGSSGGGAGAQVPWLAAGAQVVIISFHSLEDRMVKQAFQKLVSEGLAEFPRACKRQPVTPGEAEVRANPRCRSAKLRVVRLHGPAPVR